MLDCAAPMAAADSRRKNARRRRCAADVKQRVEALAQRGMRPGLAVILAGDDPASRVYVRNKSSPPEQTGVRSELYRASASISEASAANDSH